MSYTTRVEMLGADPQKVAAGARATDDVSLRHMERAMDRAMGRVQDEWARIAPVKTGAYRASLQHVVTRLDDNVHGEVFTAVDHADWVERGTGLYRSGPGSRGKIRPREPKQFLAIPGNELRIGPNKKIRSPEFSPYGENTRFLKSVRGQRAQWVARRARVATRFLMAPIFRSAAHDAARELRARI